MTCKIILAVLLPLLFTACTTSEEICAVPLLPTIVLAEEGEHDGALFARYEVTNESTQLYHFRGYEPLFPLFLVEHYTDGGWQPGPMGVCGTGLGIREFPPGASCSFEVALEGDVQIRAGIELVDEAGEVVDTIWSK